MERIFANKPTFLDGANLINVKSGYNNEISIWQKGEFKYAVRRPKEFVGLPETITALSPFIAPNKLNKEHRILNFLKTTALPVANYVYHEPSTISIYSWAQGEELDFKDKKYTQNQRLVIGENLGRFLANFHMSQESTNGKSLIQQTQGHFGLSDTISKHVFRLNETIAYFLQNQLFSAKESIEVARFGIQEIKNITPMPFRVIHGDIYSRNVFINPNSLEITSVIDWIDASEVDDPLADLILTARWFAFDDYYSDRMLHTNHADFESVINGYVSQTGKQINNPINMYKFYDLLWHLRVLVAEHVKGNSENVKQYKKTLNSLISL